MMQHHPGGLEITRRMLESAGLPDGAAVLDLGAGAGETLRLLRSLGYEARGLDREPRGQGVEQGDLGRTGFPDGSFDAVLSECSFFVSGDQSAAIGEAARLLKSGGKLLLADVFFEDPFPLLDCAGFSLMYREDLTSLWREYYLEALWRGEEPCCSIPRGKCSYWLLIAKREGGEHGSL